MGKKKYIKVQEFAEIVGVNPRLIRQYCVNGTIKSTRKGKKKNSPWFVHVDRAKDELRQNLGPHSVKIINKIGRGEGKTIKKEDANPGAKLTYAEAKELDMNYKAGIRKLTLGKLKENLIRRSDVENSAFIAGRTIKEKLISIADRLAPIVANESSTHECRQMIRKEVNYILEELSNILGKINETKE